MIRPHAQIHLGTVLLCVALMMGSLVMMTGCAEKSAQPAAAPQAPRDPIASGRASYKQYCESCHGPDGKGTGEVGVELTASPADLTQLKARYNGTFPVDSVYQAIDGRKDVEAHGTREMPVWGNIWGEEGGGPVPDEVVTKRINELVEYIRSIQE